MKTRRDFLKSTGMAAAIGAGATVAIGASVRAINADDVKALADEMAEYEGRYGTTLVVREFGDRLQGVISGTYRRRR